MAQASKYGGPSLTEAEAADPAGPQPVRVRRPQLGQVDKETYSPDDRLEDAPSAKTDGGDSTQSSRKRQTPSGQQSAANRKHAQTTESPLKPQEQESDSTAHSTGGSGRKTGTQPSRSARARTTDDDEFDEFS